jgi:hypothetical protein
MQFPLVSRELIANLRLVHGGFNLTVMLLFFYHARNGWLIRRTRLTQAPRPTLAIKRHRRMGPLLAFLGAGGFAAGLTLVILASGQVFLHPLHFFVGATILLLLFLTYRLSRQIAGPDDPQRDLHFRLGIAILALYLVNVVLGVGVLL